MDNKTLKYDDKSAMPFEKAGFWEKIKIKIREEKGLKIRLF